MLNFKYSRTSILTHLMFLIGLLYATPVAQSQTIDWVTQFGNLGDDFYSSLVRGPNGFFYAAGRNTDDAPIQKARLTKFDDEGTVIWQRNFGSTALETATDVTVDDSGNVFVTGTTGSPTSGFVRKYDSNGNLQWTTEFGSDDFDTPQGIAVIPSGEVFVVGYTAGMLGAQSFGGLDMFIAKFNSAGVLSVVIQVGTDQNDYLFDIAVGPTDGNLYVCGATAGALTGPNHGGFDSILARYAPNLGLLWRRQFGSPETDQLRGITMDVNGRPVAAGATLASMSSGFAYDVIVTKYDNAGNQLWMTQIEEPEAQFGNNVSVGDLGRVHVGGGVFSQTEYTEGFIKMFLSNGSPRWTRRINTSESDVVHGVFATPSGEPNAVFVAGATEGNLGGSNQGGNDVFFAKVSYGTMIESSQTSIFRGIESGGDESDAESADNQYWSFKPGFTLSQTEPPVWLRNETFLSFDDPDTLRVTLECTANTLGLTQEIEVFNWNTNLYDSVDQRSVSFNNDFGVFFDLSGSTGDYVEPLDDGSGRLLWQVKYDANGPTLVFPWEIFIDQLIAEVQ